MKLIETFILKTSRVISCKSMACHHAENRDSFSDIHILDTFSGRHYNPPFCGKKPRRRAKAPSDGAFPLIRKVYHESLMESRQTDPQP